MSAVLNTLRELPVQVLSVGRNLVEGLWNGINDKLLLSLIHISCTAR